MRTELLNTFHKRRGRNTIYVFQFIFGDSDRQTDQSNHANPINFTAKVLWLLSGNKHRVAYNNASSTIDSSIFNRVRATL